MNNRNYTTAYLEYLQYNSYPICVNRVISNTQQMSNFNRSAFQGHPFHLVSPSPWPIFTCISLLTLTTSGVLTMHNFEFAGY